MGEIFEYPPNTQSKIARCLGNYSKIIASTTSIGLPGAKRGMKREVRGKKKRIDMK
jgi:hypothetical protein